MALITINTDVVRPDRLRRYEALVKELASQARKQDEGWRWTAHFTAYGNTESATFHYVQQTESFAQLQQQGEVDEMVRRVMGEKAGEEMLQEANECLLASRRGISRDRPDLSYPPDPGQTTSAAALISVARARPGRQEAVEEILRKIAEAIPKLDEPIRITTYQTVIGDALQYWTVRPLDELGDLDEQLTVSDLLEKAFGPAEGGLIFRSGLEAVEQLERSITIYRDELSNAPQS